MTRNTEQSKQTSFRLHSFHNRHSYSSSRYPLTHLLDRLNIDRHLSKQSLYFQHFIYTFILLLICTIIGTICFSMHVQVYNTLFGPFHFNQEQFVEYINQYEHDPSFALRFWKNEYIQVELNENNVQNPTNTYDTIRKFSDPQTRRYHVATFKRIKQPAIYLKVPTVTQKYFHKRHQFHFQSFSIRTLQCIVRNLPSSSENPYRTWFDKTDYIQYINAQYDKNATQFNKAVLTKCGVLIGYLYCPFHEKAFTSTYEHRFKPFDIALDMTHAYYSFASFVVCGLILACLVLKSFYYLFVYLSNIIRYKILHQSKIFSPSLKVLPDVIEELWLLNADGFVHEQLLQLDEFIQKSERKLNENLSIVQNSYDELLVVILKVNLKDKLNIEDESSPFIICPVTDIQKITQYGGICYGEDSSWIPWPQNMPYEVNYAVWLHEELMDNSAVYKQRFERRLQYEPNDELPSHFTHRSLRFGDLEHQNSHGHHSRGNMINSRLALFIREENNIQRLKIERQSLLEMMENMTNPASAQFIAQFRLKHEHDKRIVNHQMVQKHIQCTLCQENLKLHEIYASWPCPGIHLFHYECMLKSLRVRNTCPNCRHEVESVPVGSNQMLLQRFFTRVFT